MWIINFLPEWMFHAVFILGVIGMITGFVLGMIPMIQQYLVPIRVVSVLLLVLGIYCEGALEEKHAWELRVREVEARLAKAEVASASANTKLVERSNSKTAKVREKTLVVKQYIDREVTKYDATCAIPLSFVRAHNDAAEGPQK